MNIRKMPRPMLTHPSIPDPGGTSPAAFSLPPAPPKVSLAPQELQNFDAGASGAPQLGHHALACTNGTGASSSRCGAAGPTGNPAPPGGSGASGGPGSLCGVSVFDILGSLLMSIGFPE